jgi:hypothetical protein
MAIADGTSCEIGRSLENQEKTEEALTRPAQPQKKAILDADIGPFVARGCQGILALTL